MALSKKQEEWLSENSYPRPRDNFKNVPKGWSTEEFWFEAVRRDGGVLEYVPEAWKTEALCLAAIQQNYAALQYIPETLNTEAFCLTAVQKDGRAFQYVPKALMTEALCIEAMLHSSVSLHPVMGQPGQYIPYGAQYATHPLQDVPEELKTEAVCLAAVLHAGGALEFVPKAMKTEAFEAKIREAEISSTISSGSGGSGYGTDLIKPTS